MGGCVLYDGHVHLCHRAGSPHRSFHFNHWRVRVGDGRTVGHLVYLYCSLHETTCVPRVEGCGLLGLGGAIECK